MTIIKKSTRIQASLFAPNEEEKQRLTARLNELRQQLTEAAPPLPVVSVPHMRCECKSDEEFGGVVRLLQKRFAPEKFSCGAISPFLSALPVTAGGLLRAEKE